MKVITILGSTGSVGTATLKVIQNNPLDFQVFALTANNNIALLYKQCLHFHPRYVVVSRKKSAVELYKKIKLTNSQTKVLYGQEALNLVSSFQSVDMVMSAIVGVAGLKPTFAAVEAGKKVLLANKEVLVATGKIFMECAKRSGALILPVDSEHSAIFQCLMTKNKFYDSRVVSKIILTASGGPFLNKEPDKLDKITPHDACMNPNWKMGKKISVDSSTMINKALEVIEAHWLFKIPVENIEVIIHPQSIIHSMVGYVDGSFIAQMALPDMRIPISYAMYYPNYNATSKILDFNLIGRELEFRKVDSKQFPAIPIVYDILKNQDYASTIVLNAANEVLVEKFLAERIKYSEIMKYIELILKELKFKNPKNIDDVVDIDLKTRMYTLTLLNLNIN